MPLLEIMMKLIILERELKSNRYNKSEQFLDIMYQYLLWCQNCLNAKRKLTHVVADRGFAPRASDAIFRKWLRAKDVQGQNRPGS